MPICLSFFHQIMGFNLRWVEMLVAITFGLWLVNDKTNTISILLHVLNGLILYYETRSIVQPQYYMDLVLAY